MDYIVAKFGGWANAAAERVKLASDLFEKNSARRIKVNSAIGKVEGLPKVTDLLHEAADRTLEEGSFPKDIYKMIKENHYAVFEPLGLSKKRIDEVLSILEEYVKKMDTMSEDYFRALLIGSGEELFSRLDAIYMKEIRGLNAKFVDPREVGHYLEGHPLDGKISAQAYDNLKVLKEFEEILVYPGFYGCDTRDRPMIYSRGGTDKTAADVSQAVGATLYENWKDVDGVLSADPRIVDKPSLMKEVTYKEIRELSYISFSVLHQEAMIPAMRSNIPINIKNLLKPESDGTLIVNERKLNKNNPVVGIAHINNVCFVNVEKSLMNEEIGLADSLMTIFREHRINIDQITTGIDSICLVVSEKEFEEKTIHSGVSEGTRKKIDIEEFQIYLKSWLDADIVQIRGGKSLICIAGEGMKHSIGLLQRVTGVLAANKINIEVIDQGASERNVIIGIDSGKDNEMAEKAVNLIYKEFFSK